jgi:hypothetical protein
MAALQRAAEPAVLNAALVRAALEEHGGPGAADAPPDAVTQLRLSYRKLLAVENLAPYARLRELRLDNNRLTRVDGLAHLRGSLARLDLSFNAIAALEAGQLDFPLLTELSLHSNQLRTLDGAGLAAGCPALQLLSLGANRLADAGELLRHLRPLRALRALTLGGNPLCGSVAPSAAGYRCHCVAVLPQLRYLDAQAVTHAEVRAVREGGVPPELLAEVEAADAAEARAAEAAAAAAARARRLGAAGVEAAAALAEASLFEGDAEYARWRSLPGVAAAVAEFAAGCGAALEELVVAGAERSGVIEVGSGGTQAPGAADGAARCQGGWRASGPPYRVSFPPKPAHPPTARSARSPPSRRPPSSW